MTECSLPSTICPRSASHTACITTLTSSSPMPLLASTLTAVSCSGAPLPPAAPAAVTKASLLISSTCEGSTHTIGPLPLPLPLNNATLAAHS